MFAKRYNQYNPYKRPFVRYGDSLEDHYTEEEIGNMTDEEKSQILDGYQKEADAVIPYIKDTMEFQNCVIFVKESDPDLSTHREFNDNNWHFYAMGNIGDSKKTDASRLTDPRDPYECILEVMDNTLPNSTMPTGKVDENGAPVYPIDPSEWVAGNSAYDSLHADKFDEKAANEKDNGLADTYGWRYIYEDGTDEENDEAKAFVENEWREFYKFVVTSTDEEFYSHLGDWVVLNSVMFYYLFTLRYTMTDNHSKNSFWHYGKTGEVDSEGNPIRKFDLAFAYDMDTSLGIDNYGRMSYRYGYEEIDYVDGTSDWVWNAPNHVFFLRLHKLFDIELCDLYKTLESSGCWSATSLINQFNDWQMQFPEELWRVDNNRKYVRTYTGSYINGAAYPEFLTERANGRKKTQRAQYEKNQEKYMSSKFGGTVASSDDIILRCSVPNTTLAVTPSFDMHLIPYSHVYLSVKYNTDVRPRKIRAVPNVEYTFEYNADLADIIEIYSASCLKSIGDLSACYLTNGTFANATKIRELTLGSDIEGYDNTNTMTLGLGSNELLNKLDIQNMSGLTHSLELSGLKNLEELYAFGSGVSGIIFADGGNIEIAELPDVGSLQMKNLTYLDDEGLKSSSYNNLSKLIAENSELDLVEIIDNAPNLRQVRLIGVDWSLPDTTLLERLYGLAGVSNTGANMDQSVLTGKVRVPVIRQQQETEYKSAWPDLEIEWTSRIDQFPVTFVNYDNTFIEVQYIDRGSTPVDPTERIENQISDPTKPSDIGTDYKFIGWSLDGETVVNVGAVVVREARTFKAVFSGTPREYTVRYISMGDVYQETKAPYGTNVMYSGETPVYTAEEGGGLEHFYLFSHWDQSGLVNGDKTINAVFDDFQYTDGAFRGRELSDLSPVEIYALTKLGVDNVEIGQLVDGAYEGLQDGDDFSFTMGFDIDYSDIEAYTLVSEKTTFNGSNYMDFDGSEKSPFIYQSGNPDPIQKRISLFEEDRDFVVAIDYKMSSDTPVGGVIAQCYDAYNSDGFIISGYNSNSEITNSSTGARFVWGASNMTCAQTNSREMIVIQHLKGSNVLKVYNSNFSATGGVIDISIDDITALRNPNIDDTFILGCAKASDGSYESRAVGEVYWCKVWYTDLGVEACKKLAGWTHEEITLEVCGFKKYYIHDGNGVRCNFSLLATHLLDRPRQYNNANINTGGWAESQLNAFLNARFYNAVPYQIKALMKQMSVPSTIGSGSSEISSSPCYVTLPSRVEVDPSASNLNPYNQEINGVNNNKVISYMNSNDARRRAFVNGDYRGYYLRSPNAASAVYVYRVDENGALQSVTMANAANPILGVLILISF